MRKLGTFLLAVSAVALLPAVFVGCAGGGGDGGPAYSVVLSPAAHTFVEGETGLQFTAALLEDGMEIQAESWIWGVSDPDMGTVNPTGYFTILGTAGMSGQVTATATYEGNTYNGSADVSLTVDADITVLRFEPSTISFADADTVDVELHFETNTSLVAWRIGLTFDHTLVSCVSQEALREGDFFDAATELIVTDADMDNTLGTILSGAIGQGDGYAGSSGTGAVLRLRFIAHDADPSSSLMFTGEPLEIYAWPVSNPAVPLVTLNTTNASFTP